MSDNGKGEQGIRPCPMPGCGSECSVEKVSPPQDDSTYYYVVKCNNFCGYVCQLLDTEADAIAAHNELCKLVEKGRKHDEVIAAIKETLGAMYDKVHAERDEAVRLLRQHEYDMADFRRIQVSTSERRKILLARDDIKKIGGGE